MRWPGVFPAGAVSRTPFVLHDLFPTFREIVGLPKAPTVVVETGQETLAMSMLSVWKTGEEDTVRARRFLHFEFCDDPKGEPMCVTATMDLVDYFDHGKVYKLVQLGNKPQTKQVFELNASPKETAQMGPAKAKTAKLAELVAARNALRRPFDSTACFSF